MDVEKGHQPFDKRLVHLSAQQPALLTCLALSFEWVAVDALQTFNDGQ